MSKREIVKRLFLEGKITYEESCILLDRKPQQLTRIDDQKSPLIYIQKGKNPFEVTFTE